MPELIRFSDVVQSRYLSGLGLCTRERSSFADSIIWKITESVSQLLEMVPLSEHELRCFELFKSEQRQRQWLAYRCALMALNGGTHLPVIYDSVGKPFIENSDFHISVSHSGNYAMAIKSNRRCGVDIEHQSDKAHRVRAKFMSKPEMAFADTVDSELISRFTWSAKEAMYKAMGVEGVIFAEEMGLSDFDFEKCTAKGRFCFENETADFQIHFYQHPEFVAARVINQ